MSDKIQAQIDALEDNIASGILEFEFEGQKTKYRSLREMTIAVDRLKGRLMSNPSEPGSGVWVGGFDKGYRE